MSNAPTERNDQETRAMLAAQRSAQQPSHPPGGLNATRIPFFSDQSSAHAWPPPHHLPAHPAQPIPQMNLSGALDPQSYSQLVVNSNDHDFATNRPPLDLDAAALPRFDQSYGADDLLSGQPYGHQSIHPQPPAHYSQHQRQPYPTSTSPVTAKSGRSAGGSGRAPRGAVGKGAVSVANKNTAGSGPSSSGAGRNAQPKSSRKQFSACGACQTRQVKCDLKDRTAEDGEGASCTACQERGINCVSAYAQSQKPKTQRRGKRLREVEAKFGKKELADGTSGDAGGDAHLAFGSGLPGTSSVNAGRSSSSPIAAGLVYHADSLASSCIPALQPEFLDTPFYRSFHTQRPIIDPHEFRERFMESYERDPTNPQVARRRFTPIRAGPNNGGASATARATDELSLMADVLVTWAASYGIDEFGREDADEHLLAAYGSDRDRDRSRDAYSKRELNDEDERARINSERKKLRRERISRMVKEILEGIDRLALLRRPSWDGVRVLMLLMPLTEDSLGSVERLSMYQSTIAQIYTLCTHGSSLLGGSDRKKMVVARIFWYAYVHEGITSGLRGGKLIFDNDDLDVFEASHPKFRGAGANGLAMTAQPTLDRLSYKFSTAPIRLSTACRQINLALTGPKASIRRDVDKQQLEEGWEKLMQCWEEFDDLREVLLANDPNLFLQRPDMERFISGWQVFLFECLNVIREVLSQKIEDDSSSPAGAYISEVNETANGSNDSRSRNLRRLHELAEDHCRDKHPRVMKLIIAQLESPTFFQWDASLVRDGTFYAGKWAATDASGRSEDVQACISALRKMKWAFSLSEDRIQTIQFAFNRRVPPNVAPVTSFGAGGSGGTVFREEVFQHTHFPAAPSMPSDSAQDPFDQYWARSTAGLPTDQRQTMATSFIDPQSRQPHGSSQILSAAAPSNAGSRSGWDWVPQGGNGIPAAKLQRLSPDELEAHHATHRVSPPSASSSTDFPPFPHAQNLGVYDNGRNPGIELPSIRGYQMSQNNAQWDSQMPPSSQGQPPFVRIEANAQHMNYPPELSYREPSRHHEQHHQQHHIPNLDYNTHPAPVYNRAPDSHSDEGADVLYMPDTHTQLNRTRYPGGA